VQGQEPRPGRSRAARALLVLLVIGSSPRWAAALPGYSFPRSASRCSASSIMSAAASSHDDSSTAQGEFEREEDVLCGAAEMKVVGIKYYPGVLHKGEYAFLVREPRNPYDANAIAVKNHVGSQVGHIARDFAACLAPIMDDTRPFAPAIEALVLQPAVSSVKIQVSFYAPASCRQRTNKRLQRHGIVLTQATGRGEGEGGQGGADTAVVSKVDGSAVLLDSQRALKELFDKLEGDRVEDLTACRGGVRGKLKTQLLPHQEQGVAWMLHRERSTVRLPFWKEMTEKGKKVFFNEITNTSYTEDPGKMRGGILVDDMGMGKTLQVLALIVANPATGGGAAQDGACGAGGASVSVIDGGASGSVIDLTCDGMVASAGNGVCVGGKGWGGVALKKAKTKEAQASCSPPLSSSSSGRVRGATLVVCPASVIANWQEQAELHVQEAYGLKVMVHHGKSKETSDGLAQADLVITSFGTLAAELEGRAGGGGGGGAKEAEHGQGAKRKRETSNGGLMGVKWHRVVLDEAHNIRNRGTKAFKACVALSSRFRWALTGTPIQNKVEDVHSLFEFVRARPLDDVRIFRQAIAQPIRNGQVCQCQ